MAARDSSVKRLKNREPVVPLAERIRAIEDLTLDAMIIAGDSEHESWQILREYKPTMIALGHNQHALKKSLDVHILNAPYEIELTSIKKLHTKQTFMSNMKKAEWILRIAVAGEFIGHGIFALQQKQGWIKYFEAVGFSPDMALTIMP